MKIRDFTDERKMIAVRVHVQKKLAMASIQTQFTIGNLVDELVKRHLPDLVKELKK